MKRDKNESGWSDSESEHEKHRRVKAEQERLLRKRLSHPHFGDADELRGLEPRDLGH